MMNTESVSSNYQSVLTVVYKENEETREDEKQHPKIYKDYSSEYSKWIMPEQRSGFIKSRKHDCL